MNATISYSDKEILKTMKYVEKMLSARRPLISGGIFSYEDIVSEAIATIVEKNLPLSYTYRRASWLLTDKIRTLTHSRKKDENGFTITKRPIPTSFSQPGDSAKSDWSSNFEDKKVKAEVVKNCNNNDFRQLLKCLPVPEQIKKILEDMYVNNLTVNEVGFKYEITSHNVHTKLRYWRSEMAVYLKKTGRYHEKKNITSVN